MTARLIEIDKILDEIHESCPPQEGSCWCCCLVCTETDVAELVALQGEYWRIVASREA